MVTPSKDISTETMAQIAKSKDNKYELLYFPFHGVLPALRAMFAMSGADYTFTHPVVSSSFKMPSLFTRNMRPLFFSSLLITLPVSLISIRTGQRKSQQHHLDPSLSSTRQTPSQVTPSSSQSSLPSNPTLATSTVGWATTFGSAPRSKCIIRRPRRCLING